MPGDHFFFWTLSRCQQPAAARQGAHPSGLQRHPRCAGSPPIDGDGVQLARSSMEREEKTSRYCVPCIRCQPTGEAQVVRPRCDASGRKSPRRVGPRYSTRQGRALERIKPEGERPCLVDARGRPKNCSFSIHIKFRLSQFDIEIYPRRPGRRSATSQNAQLSLPATNAVSQKMSQRSSRHTGGLNLPFGSLPMRPQDRD
jgi:hypothetical protein